MPELFYTAESNMADYANDSTLYKYETNLIEVRAKIETESLKVFERKTLKQLALNHMLTKLLRKDNAMQMNVWLT